MTNCSFKVGQRLDWGGKSFQVKELTRHKVMLSDLKTGAAHTVKKSDLVTVYESGSLIFRDLLAGQDSCGQFDRSLKDYSKIRRDEALVKIHYLQNICPRGHVLCKRAELREKLRVLWSELPDGTKGARPPCIASFYKWRDTWIRSGYQARAMVNKFDLRGRKCKEADPQVLEYIEEAIDTTYLQLNRPTITETLDHANGLIEKNNQNVPPTDRIPRVCRREIIREINKIHRQRLLTERYGPAKAEAATKVYGKKDEPHRVLERVEVDHTPLDVIALSSQGGVLGRPYLTVLIDVASRMILGIWISFQPPNSGAVLRALKVAISSKTKLLKKLKIKGPYEAEGMIESLFLDNGLEFHGDDLEGVAMDLRIELVYCPRRKPRFKGVVERWLKEVNYRFMHLLPGTTLDHFEERNDLDPFRDAVIPIDDLLRLIWKWIVEVYSVSWNRSIKNCPREKWKVLAKNEPPIKAPDHESLTFHTSPLYQRKLSAKGIQINGQFYTGGCVDRIRSARGNMELTVRPDLDDLGQIYVLDPDSKTYFTAISTDPTYAKGLSVEEDKWISKLARDKYRELGYETGRLLAKQEIRDEVAEMTRRAEEKADATNQSPAKDKKRRTRTKKAVHAMAQASKASKTEINQEDATNGPQKAGRTPNFDHLSPYPTGQSPLF